jgi:hypothetical protein
LNKAESKPVTKSVVIKNQYQYLGLKKNSRFKPLVTCNYYNSTFLDIKISCPNVFEKIWHFNNGDLGITMQYNMVNKINTSIRTANAYANKLSRNNFSESSSSSQKTDFSVGFGEQLLIGSGRAFVKTGQGIKQLGLSSGEILGILEAGRTAIYTEKINNEKELYNNTLVGQSIVAKSGEILTDIVVTVTIPGGTGSTGAKLVAGSAITGAFIAGLQATEDGSLSSRAQNAGIGAVEGAVGGYVFNKTAQGIHWAWKEGKTQYGLYSFDKKVEVPHVFSKAKGGQAPKYGHVYDTPENRRIITETFTDQNNFIFKNQRNVEIFAKHLPDGTEAWSEIYKGKVRSAGINKIPKYYNIDGSLKNNHITSNAPKL